MFEQLKPIEKALGGIFKDLPALPTNAKKTLVNIFPWLALIFGLIQIWGFWALWDVGHRANDVIDTLSRTFGVTNAPESLGLTYWVALIFLGISALTLLMAYPGLKNRKKTGWDWLFLGSLINVVYGVISIFIDQYYGGGMGNFFMALIGSAIGFYLLFQVRERYNGEEPAPKDKLSD